MSLWDEHIVGLESSFERPESLECLRRVRWLSKSIWNQYEAVEVTDVKAHLPEYPIEVDCVGHVKPFIGCLDSRLPRAVAPSLCRRLIYCTYFDEKV